MIFFRVRSIRHLGYLVLALVLNCFCVTLAYATPTSQSSSNQSTAKNNLPVLDRIVAVVNSDAIPESELNRQMQLLLLRLKQTEMNLPSEAELRKQLLDKMIIEKLQLQMAKESKIEVTEENLNDAINDMAKRDGLTLAQMQKFLEDQGVTFEQFRKTIKNEMLISKLQQREIGQNIIVSNNEIDYFIKSPAGIDQSGIEYRLGHILLSLPEAPSAEKVAEVEKKAEAIVKQLRAGADFSQTAMSKSAGPQALNGGDLGFRNIQELPTIFAKIAPSLVKEQIMDPIRNDSGFHIIKLIDKRHSNTANNVQASKEEFKNKVMDILFQRKFEDRLATWLRRVRDDAEIQIYLNET